MVLYTPNILYLVGIQILFALFLFILSNVILVKKWGSLLAIFKVCIILFNIASLIRVCYGVTFVVAKHYKQGEYVAFFKMMDLVGGLESFSFSITGILLYALYWQAISKMKMKSFTKATRKPILIISTIMIILSIVGNLSFFTAGSEIMYYICYMYYVLLLIGATIFYAYTMVKLICLLSKSPLTKCSNIFKKSSRESEDTLRKVVIIFTIQFICLILVIILFVYISWRYTFSRSSFCR